MAGFGETKNLFAAGVSGLLAFTQFQTRITRPDILALTTKRGPAKTGPLEELKCRQETASH
jgi:hypothetical protein